MLEWLPTCSEELIAPLSIITRARSLSLVRALYLITNLKITLLITDTDTIILNNHRRCCSAPFDIRLFDGSALGLCESNLNSITLGHTRNMASRMRKTGKKKAALFAESTAPALELHDITSAKKVKFRDSFVCHEAFRRALQRQELLRLLHWIIWTALTTSWSDFSWSYVREGRPVVLDV